MFLSKPLRAEETKFGLAALSFTAKSTEFHSFTTVVTHICLIPNKQKTLKMHDSFSFCSETFIDFMTWTQ